jgi:4-amino-4-deoxy-L-arabinose transferase-like glycosyltransferase
MFIGFIPVLVAFAAALTSLRNPRSARVLWIICALLVTSWTVFHGRHHVPDLMTLGSW